MYTYDAGGNRMSKTDYANIRYTEYLYDIGACQSYGSYANRLMTYSVYESTVGPIGDPLETVDYEYFDSGDAAGNVSRVVRRVPRPGLPDIVDAFANCLTYNRAGELWIVTQQFWLELFGQVNGDVETAVIREFRGNGRERYMIRERVADDQSPDFLKPLYESAVWTDYDGDAPTGDWTIDFQAPAYQPEQIFLLGLAHIDPGVSPEASYTHANHLGSTRMTTDDTPSVTGYVVYTAFGEPVYENGDVGTRYRYAGAHGYEDFGALDWGENFQQTPIPFPYLHLGHRWYDPETGRFLQRDPIGISGGYNVYAYADGSPVFFVDPDGESTTVDRGMLQALASGNVQRVKLLFEAVKDLLSPKVRKQVVDWIVKMESRVLDWGKQKCQGTIWRKFPGGEHGKYAKMTMEQLNKARKTDREAQTAWKLLTDGRWQK